MASACLVASVSASRADILSPSSPADYFGRKFNIALLTTFLVIACALEVTTNKVEVWTVGKLLAGFATGLVQSSVAT